MSLTAEFIAALHADGLGEIFTQDPQLLTTYGVDWTSIWQPAPGGLARPRTAHEVASLVRLCRKFAVAIVPSGGRTGLAGGAVAASGELIVSLERINHIFEVDVIGQTVSVGAGAVTQHVHEVAATHGLFWPVDLASKGSCQIGGNIATNAGGVRVIRYGHTRNWILGLEVVTGAGEILSLGGSLEKNNTGADLRQAFIGSEGIFGIVTGATLKLTKLPTEPQVMLFAAADLPRVMAIFALARRGPFTINAFEFFTDRCAARVARHRHVKPPFADKAPGYALIECEGASFDNLLSWTEEALQIDGVLDGVLAQSATQAAQLWTLREGISESLAATGRPHKNDISVPVAELPRFCARLEHLIGERYPGWEVCLFGHVGDGNLHVNVMKPETMAPAIFESLAHDADREIFELVAEFSGSISAEHGIGLLKRDFLHHCRTPSEISLMRQLKRVFDPDGILNPGKVLP